MARWQVALGIIVALTVSVVLGENWRPAPAGLMTRWGKQMDPQNVWPEYPRPQMVRSEWLCLNGLWDYQLQQKTASMPMTFERKILVPFCAESALSGAGDTVTPDHRLWYRRIFQIPGDWADKRILLRFEAVDWETAVWLNGAYLGSHQGAYDRFSFDITDYINKDQKDQQLIVSVWDPTNFGSQARGKQQIPQEGIWYTPVSGIWQTVWLEPVNKAASIREIKIVPDVDRQSVSVLSTMYEPSVEKYDVRTTILDGQKQIGQDQTLAGKAAVISISEAKLWSPDNPFLYDLKIELLNPGGEVIDEIASYFGMRKISLGDGPNGKVLHLNNRFLFHYGTLDQGWWPDGLHTPPSDEAMRYDIEMTKQMGFNMIRKHIKVEPARWYYWCDKLGMLVWQDMPSGMVSIPREKGRRPHHVEQIQKDAPDLNRRTQTAAQFEYELRRMVDLHFNAPCIVIWVPFNEGWGQYDTERINSFVKHLDPTRLVNAVSGWSLRACGDVYDIHTYQQQVEAPPMQADRATVIGEYGGIGYPVEGHLWNPAMRNWGYQTYQSAQELYDNYVHKFNQIVEMKNRGLSAAVYTQTTDVEGEVNGLMTYDRQVVKIPSEKLNELHKVVYGTPVR